MLVIFGICLILRLLCVLGMYRAGVVGDSRGCKSRVGETVEDVVGVLVQKMLILYKIISWMVKRGK